MTNLGRKNAKKLLFFLCLCIILLIIYGVIRIYALFHSELGANVQLKNGTWNITVNGTDITKGTDIQFAINNVTVEENEHVKPGNIAPGLTGTFKINIDPENTNVSTRYDIYLDEEKLTNPNIQIKSIKETLNGNELVKTDKNTYTGIIPLEKIQAGTTNEITVEVEWIENEDHNEEDIGLGTTWDAEYQIPITVHVCQYLGEQLNLYTGK